MPIYLVRWPDLSASLVRAQHEDDLIDTLDQVANPDGCEWAVYKGPLFIDSSGGQVTFHQHEDFPGVGSIDTMITATLTSANALACAATGMGMTVAEAPSGCNRPPEVKQGEIVECDISVFATAKVPFAFLSFEFAGTETHTACGQETITQPFRGSLFARLEGTPIFTNGVITAIDFNRTTTNGNELTVTTGIVELGPCTTAGCPGMD
jgi:hypothetical protein